MKQGFFPRQILYPNVSLYNMLSAHAKGKEQDKVSIHLLNNFTCFTFISRPPLSFPNGAGVIRESRGKGVGGKEQMGRVNYYFGVELTEILLVFDVLIWNF